MGILRRFGLVFALLLLGHFVPAQSIFINELHYDDAGADTLEGVEIAGPAGTNLACFKIILYNGANGLPYDSLQLSGVLGNMCNGFGVAWFPIAGGLQNGSPDGLALIFDPTLPGCGLAAPPQVIQFLSYEGSFMANSGLATGMVSTALPVQESSSTPELQSLQLTGQGYFYSEFAWQSPSPNSIGTVNPGQNFNGAPCGTSTGPVSTYSLRDFEGGCITPGTPFNLTVCAEDINGLVDLNYGGGTAVAQISIASGPGVLSGVTSTPVVAGCAYFSNLILSAPGAIRLSVFDIPPFGTGLRDTLGQLVVVASCDSCPWMTGAFIDACGPTEGNNEILFFNSGSFHIPTGSNSWGISYGATNPPATGYTSSFTQNQAYIDSLNAWAGCNLFVNPQDSGGVPPGNDFIVLRWDPNYAYDFSGWCTKAPVYVFFTADQDWNTTGNFKNCIDCGVGESGTNDRFFELDFTGLPNADTCQFIYQYNPCAQLLCSGSGDGLNFGYGGGGPTLAWSNCVPLAVLPVNEWGNFEGDRVNSAVLLTWEAILDRPDGQFEVYRRAPEEGSFQWIGTQGAQSKWNHTFQYWDHDALESGLFYRLRTQGYDGQSVWSETIYIEPVAAMNQISGFFHAQLGQILWHGLDEQTEIHLFTVEGKQLSASDRQQLTSGIYFWQAFQDGRMQAGKIWVQR